MSENPQYKVCVRCMTFNQSKYIVDALNGFCMQQTNFPFVCCIVDDASTDGEQIIIKQYLQSNFIPRDEGSTSILKQEKIGEVIFAQHKINRNCFFVVVFLNKNHYQVHKDKLCYLSEWRDNSEFEAICEGDDFWTNPQKLQLQADFLSNNKEYVLCTHAFRKLINNVEGPYINKSVEPFSYDLRSSLKNWYTQPLTAMYRIEAYPSREEREKYSNFMDNHLYYLLLQKGKGYHIGICMGVYRISGEGVWTSISKLKTYSIDLNSYIELYYNNNKDKLLCNKINSIYSSYLCEAIFDKEKPMAIPVKILGLSGTFVTILKTIKKVFQKTVKNGVVRL